MPRHYEDFTGKIVNGIKVVGLVTDSGGAGKHKRWKCECPVCHKEFITQSNHLKVRDSQMCSDCASTQCEDLTGQKFGHLTVDFMIYTGKYERTKCSCTCDCGCTGYIVEAKNIKAGYTKSCGCLKSFPEELIAQILTDNNVEFVKEKRFEGLAYKKLLRCDFYIPDKNLVIEYNGEQHYKSIQGWGGEKQFKIIQERDRIKREYCMEHNIGYMIIRYDEGIEEALLKNNIIMKR